MKINKSGNIKLVTILFLLGSLSSVLLIPAVIQKQSNEHGSIKGNNDFMALTKTENQPPIEKTIETIKKEYIEVPITKVVETTKEIKTYIDNPSKIIYKEVTVTQTSPSTNLISQVLTNPLALILGESDKNPVVKTNPESQIKTPKEPEVKTSEEPMMKITKEMVENCKLITNEFNKASK